MATRREETGSALTGSRQRSLDAVSRLADDTARRDRLAADVGTWEGRTVGTTGGRDHSWSSDRAHGSHVDAKGKALSAAPLPDREIVGYVTRDGSLRPVGHGRAGSDGPDPGVMPTHRDDVASVVYLEADGASGDRAAGQAASILHEDRFKTSVTRAEEFGSRFGTDAKSVADLARRTSSWTKRQLDGTVRHTLKTEEGTLNVDVTKVRRPPGKLAGAAAAAMHSTREAARAERDGSGVAMAATVVENRLRKRGAVPSALHSAAALGDGDDPISEADHAWQTGRNAYRGARTAIRQARRLKGGASFTLRHLRSHDLKAAIGQAARKRAIKLRYTYSLSRRIRGLREAGRVISGQGLGTWARSVVNAFVKRGLAAAKAGLGKLAAGLLAGGVGVVGAMFLLLLVGALLSAAAGGAKQQVEGLSDTEQAVYQFFKGKDLGDVQIAAIMGNMWAESGMDPAAIQSSERDWSDDELLALGDEGGRAIGLPQWDGGRRTSLISWARSQERDWRDVSTQLEFFWDHDEWQTDWSGGKDGHYGNKYRFLAATDAEDACRQFYYGWERGGVDRMTDRINATNRYLALISRSYAGQDYAAASDQQKAIVDSCYVVPSPGSGLCAAWVYRVYADAGLDYASGNACDLYRWYCHSSDRSELKVGMLVASPSCVTAGEGTAGWEYGHVGIYIGDGKVISNSSGVIKTEDFDDFVHRIRAATLPVRWGFPCDVATN